MAILLEDVLSLMNYQQSELYNSEIPKEHPDYNKWLEKLPSELSRGISVIVTEREDGVDVLAQTKKLTITIYSPLNLDSFAYELGHALSNKFELKKHLANHPRSKHLNFDGILADLVKSFITKIGFLGEATRAELKQVLGEQAYGSLR